MNRECDKCAKNAGQTEDSVHCLAIGDIRPFPVSHCAEKELTIAGWVEVTNGHEVKGDMQSGQFCRDRILEIKRSRRHEKHSSHT